MKTIVWAVDGSECAWRAAEWAAEMLDKWPEAELVAVYAHVPTVPAADAWTGIGMPTVMDVEAQETALEQELREEVMTKFKAYAGRVTFRGEYGAPADAIVSVADEVNADLIVMGTHGRKGLDRMLMGSVSTGVLHRARQAVLVVR
ncbi:universal stress protein [Alicyclobacillus sendaiensis]|uniref:universal stress protein n=1 Tax=Alicyclobacillus sendaiensis TaxID=192387 RepID=UPI00078601A7|nr:universal stress protein [Alicyclobacillus sendaiensis]